MINMKSTQQKDCFGRTQWVRYTVVMLLLVFLGCNLCCNTFFAANKFKSNKSQIIGSTIEIDYIGKIKGRFSKFAKFNLIETYNYAFIYEQDSGNFPIRYPLDFYIIHRIPRPADHEVTEDNRYSSYWKIISFGITIKYPDLADTNVVVYVDVDDLYTYLISTELSPKIKNDTLLVFKNDDINNWLYHKEYFECSLKDSIISVPEIENGCHKTKIYRINPYRKCDLHKIIIGGFSQSFSYDFTQLLLLKSLCNEPDSALRGRGIIIYDILKDTLYHIGSDKFGYSSPKRSNRNDYIYYLKIDTSFCELWCVKENGIEEPVFQPKFPEYVARFRFDSDDAFIFIHVGDITTGKVQSRAITIEKK